MAEVITVDNINIIDTENTNNGYQVTQNTARVSQMMAQMNDLTNSKADKYWHVAFDGVNYLNSGSTVTLSLGSKTLSDVTEIRFIFSHYDTDGHNAVADGCFQYSMTNSNDSDVYDGFYDTVYITMPSKANESGTDWQSFFFTKAFNLDAPNKVVGKGTTQINDDSFACVLRTVLVKY